MGSAVSRLRALLTIVAKTLVTGGLFFWLSACGALDLRNLRILIVSPEILGATLLTWVLVGVLLSTLRWKILLGAAGVQLSLRRAVALQLMGLFFNSVVPGNIGGDVLKNLYVLQGRKTQMFVTVIGERLAGLFGLIWVGALMCMASYPQLEETARLRPLILLIALLMLGTVLAPVALAMSLRVLEGRSGDKRGALSRLRRKLTELLQLFRGHRRELLMAWGVSMVLHLVNLLYFFTIARAMGNPDAELARVALVFPLGILTMVLPISVAGLGVGHVAFQQLFAWVGLVGGANVFNVFIVGALAPCLLGAIPYLFLRSERPQQLAP